MRSRRTTARSTPTAASTAARSRTSSSTTSTRRRRRRQGQEARRERSCLRDRRQPRDCARRSLRGTISTARRCRRCCSPPATRTGATARDRSAFHPKPVLHEAQAMDDGLAAGLPGRGEDLREVHPQHQASPHAKIGILYQNDAYGQNYLAAFKKGLGSTQATSVVARGEAYTVGEERRTIMPRIGQLKADGANTVVLFATPGASIAALVDWRRRSTGRPAGRSSTTSRRTGSSCSRPRAGANLDGVISTTLHQEPDGHAGRSVRCSSGRRSSTPRTTPA